MASIPTRSGSKSATGDLMSSAANQKMLSGKDRMGPSRKNVTYGAKRVSNPSGGIRSVGQMPTGPDQGTG